MVVVVVVVVVESVVEDDGGGVVVDVAGGTVDVSGAASPDRSASVGIVQPAAISTAASATENCFPEPIPQGVMAEFGLQEGARDSKLPPMKRVLVVNSRSGV